MGYVERIGGDKEGEVYVHKSRSRMETPVKS